MEDIFAFTRRKRIKKAKSQGRFCVQEFGKERLEKIAQELLSYREALVEKSPQAREKLFSAEYQHRARLDDLLDDFSLLLSEDTTYGCC